MHEFILAASTIIFGKSKAEPTYSFVTKLILRGKKICILINALIVTEEVVDSK